MKLRIHSKLSIGFALVLIVSFIIQTISFFVIDKYIERKTNDALLTTAKAASNEIESFVTSIELAHLNIGQFYFSESTPEEISQKLIIDTVLRNTFINTATVLSVSGKELTKIDRFGNLKTDELSFEIPTKPFTHALSGATSISKVYTLEGQTIPFIDIFSPVINKEGVLLGVIKSRIQLEGLWEVVAKIRLGNKGFAYVVDEEGRLLAHPRNPLSSTIPDIITDRKIVSTIIHSPAIPTVSNYTYINEDDNEVIAQGVKIQKLGWGVIAEQPEEEAFEQRFLLRSLFIATLILSSGLMVVIAFFLSEQISSPIGKLKYLSEQLEHGLMDTRVDIRTGDEIEELSIAFNRMAGRLQQAFIQLQGKVKELESNKNRLNQSTQLLLHRDTDLNVVNEKLAEEMALMKAERNKLGIVLSGVSDGVIAVNMHHRIVLFNHAAEKILGVNADEVLGKRLSEVITVFDTGMELPLSVYCPISETDKEGIIYRKQNVKVVSSSGITSHTNLLTGRILEGAEADLGAIVTIHDITTEQELERMKLDFVSMAAHELRTPLTTVLGYVSFLQDPSTIQKLTEDEKDYLNRVSSSAMRLSQLIENLLVVSRIEQGTMVLKQEVVQLESLADKLVGDFKPLAQTKHLELNFVAPDTVLSPVKADVLRIGEVISNLIGNAINYTDKGSVTVQVKQRGKSIVFSVTDTGPGIPEKARVHLFSKFFRIQNKVESGAKGTGLGLYISKNIVGAHGGDIWVDSEEGKGSTFSFSIPSVEDKQ